MNRHRLATTTFALLCASACADDGGPPLQTDSDSTGAPATTTSTSSTSVNPTTGEAGSGGSSSTGEDTEPGPWNPNDALPSLDDEVRGHRDVRGLIHAHSPYSHDACDGEPRDENGVIDATCFDDLREGLCRTQHEFVMLTDHRDSFSDTEYPDTLLYDADRGDVLVERGGAPVANWTGCPDVDPVLVMAGTESGSMPVGLESHVPTRSEIYGDFTVDAIEAFKDHGAVVILQHTENWEVSDIVDMPVDGFEMYNVHANLFLNIAEAAAVAGLAMNAPERLPLSDLTILPVWEEDPIYLATWGSVLASGARRVTTLGTDSHRNSLPQLLPDGERVDSFRRMMKWFSNHLLIVPEADGSWDDRHLKEALREGRLYGAFEYLGYPGGFDARAETPEATFEIGSEVQLGDGPELVAVAPTVRELDPEAEAPVITLHLLRAIDGGFEEVADGSDELRYMPDTAGAYRFEVRIAPKHLRPYLGDYAVEADDSRVWIYANPFYVRDGASGG